MDERAGRALALTRWRAGPLIGSLALVAVGAAGAAEPPKYRITDLTPFSDCGGYAPCSEPYALNEAGQVTGSAEGTQGFNAYRSDRDTQTELEGLPGAVFSGGWAINEAGQVAGYAYNEQGDVHAALWNADATGVVDLGTLGGSIAVGVAINAAGQVVGYSMLAGGGTRAFIWDGAGMLDLGTLGGNGSGATDINAAGQVVGSAGVDEWSGHAFLWDGVTMNDLGTLADGLGDSRAIVINDAGQVAGLSMTFPDGDMHAFLWTDGVMQDLGTLGGRESLPTAMNETGRVVGISTYIPGQYLSGYSHAFLWDGVALRDLGTLGGATSRANDINAAGIVVGSSRTATNAERPFLWDGTQMHDLNYLVDPADPAQPYVTLFRAWYVNDRGDVVAEGRDSRLGDLHSYLLSVVRPREVRLDGFGAPVDAPPVLNTAQSGRTIPLRFSVTTSAGAPVVDLGTVQVTATPRACSGFPGATDAVEQYSSVSSGTLLHLGSGRYQYNWKVAKGTGGCCELTLALPDGFDATPTGLTALFRFAN